MRIKQGGKNLSKKCRGENNGKNYKNNNENYKQKDYQKEKNVVIIKIGFNKRKVYFLRIRKIHKVKE
jgi:hypothetical protein